jgi:hypothetical protein
MSAAGINSLYHFRQPNAHKTDAFEAESAAHPFSIYGGRRPWRGYHVDHIMTYGGRQLIKANQAGRKWVGNCFISFSTQSQAGNSLIVV